MYLRTLCTKFVPLLVLAFAEKQDPDPTCARGILAGAACCPSSCGKCGGSGCGALPGGSSSCCSGAIDKNRSCGMVEPPCILPPAPPPATTCGDFPLALMATRPNVLLIGDSISMAVPFTPGGYGANTKAALEAKNISVWHQGGWQKGGQASNTVKGLKCTEASTAGEWLNVTGTYDVIHFNFGLHDLVDAGPGEGAQHVEVEQYGKNIAELYSRFAARAKKVIFATTTPCPNVTTSMGRSDAKVVAYNAAAVAAVRTVAASLGAELLVDDLYSAVDGYCGKDYKTCDLQKPANVHFESKGCQFMADKVVDSIVKALDSAVIV